MPFSVCASLGTFLSLAAVVLCVDLIVGPPDARRTIFVSISQIRPNQTVPRHVRMALIDTTGFGQAVVTASGGNGGVPADFYGSGNGVRCTERAGDQLTSIRPVCVRTVRASQARLALTLRRQHRRLGVVRGGYG